LLLALALCIFGYLVYNQAAQRAYSDLDATLSSRAASVKLGKYTVSQSALPSILPGIAGAGTEGVAIEVLDDHLRLLATTDNVSSDYLHTYVAGSTSSPVPWDAGAARTILRDPFAGNVNPDSMYNTITYQGQPVRVYTLANDDFGQTHIIQTARSEQDIEQSLSNLRMLLVGGGALVILLASLGGWLIAAGVLARVRRITRTAYSISQKGHFSQRIARQAWGSRDELSQLAETFNTMLDRLEQLFRSQQRFIADASHELRAPITSISCNLDLLAKAPDLPPEEAQAALVDARTEADRMGRLVNDLLTLARADSHQSVDDAAINNIGQAEKRIEPVDLDSLVLEVFRQYRPSEEQEASELKHRPRLLLQHITPVRVVGDADQLKQALVALVDNALKYTPPSGTVCLALTVDERRATVTVTDTGIGIAPEDIPHIFERFYRADPARSRDQGGSGLGLSIAQNIIHDHHGTIDVVSAPGEGSIFTVRLPCIPDVRPAP
jgi:signal transduction histidine kinase